MQPEPAPSPESTVSSKFRVGDVVLAVWTEDKLYYRARVDSVRDAGTPAERYHVVFIEYGNAQPDTPLSSIAVCPPNVVTAPLPDPEPESVSVAESSSHGEAKNQAAPALDHDQELQDMERSANIPKRPDEKAAPAPTSGKVIGILADGTPILMTAEDEARQKALRKQEKKEKSEQRKEKGKKLLSALTKPKKRDEEEQKQPPTILSGEWRKVSAGLEGEGSWT
jgi:hypothetical protein